MDSDGVMECVELGVMVAVVVGELEDDGVEDFVEEHEIVLDGLGV
jgi:hypothetical protein